MQPNPWADTVRPEDPRVRVGRAMARSSDDGGIGGPRYGRFAGMRRACAKVAAVLAVHLAAAVLGTLVVGATLVSALQTVVVPRAGVSRLTWAHFVWIRWVFDKVAHPRR